MASMIDLLTRTTWLQGMATAAALDKKDRKLLKKPPPPMERPGDRERRAQELFRKRTGPKRFAKPEDLLIGNILKRVNGGG